MPSGLPLMAIATLRTSSIDVPPGEIDLTLVNNGGSRAKGSIKKLDAFGYLYFLSDWQTFSPGFSPEFVEFSPGYDGVAPVWP
jgi:hypothetical protein